MKGKKRVGLSHRRALYGYIFIFPFLLGFIFMTLSPVVLYLVIGFSKVMAGSSGITLIPVGWQNYEDLFFNEVGFWENVAYSIGDMLIIGTFIVIFSLFIATVLNQKFRGRGLVRGIFFLPLVIASGVAAMNMNDSLVDAAWKALSGMSEGAGLITGFLNMVGVSFGDSFLSIITELMEKFYNIVLSSGVQILIFLAGLQTISPSLYEAANIDGATAWERYWKITFPMISPMILVNAVYTVIDQLNNADNTIINTLYQYSSNGSKYGLSSAMGTVYFGIVLILMAIIFLVISRFVVYEER